MGAAATTDHHANGKHMWELPLAPSYTSNPCQWRANAPGSRKGWRKGLIRTAAWSTLIRMGAAAMESTLGSFLWRHPTLQIHASGEQMHRGAAKVGARG